MNQPNQPHFFSLSSLSLTISLFSLSFSLALCVLCVPSRSAASRSLPRARRLATASASRPPLPRALCLTTAASRPPPHALCSASRPPPRDSRLTTASASRPPTPSASRSRSSLYASHPWLYLSSET
ncbi:hypothetical protein Scep_029221 [Stephania cephalantha]|uniref:Uncharacterized protein n=1 Tax=Stephania cephalantha TaxID=152367 RepID=A0AAP0DX77_9MAGN